jgi:large subunit ribosomal protein L30
VNGSCRALRLEIHPPSLLCSFNSLIFFTLKVFLRYRYRRAKRYYTRDLRRGKCGATSWNADADERTRSVCGRYATCKRCRTPKVSIENSTANAISYSPRQAVSYSINSFEPSSSGTMAFFKITLRRSAIGLPQKTRGVLAALGLRKRMRTVFHPVSTEVAGQIMKVKELVAVQEVEEALNRQEMRKLRQPDPGYYVETAMPR